MEATVLIQLERLGWHNPRIHDWETGWQRQWMDSEQPPCQPWASHWLPAPQADFNYGITIHADFNSLVLMPSSFLFELFEIIFFIKKL